jgi:hypothetical protein
MTLAAASVHEPLWRCGQFEPRLATGATFEFRYLFANWRRQHFPPSSKEFFLDI